MPTPQVFTAYIDPAALGTTLAEGPKYVGKLEPSAPHAGSFGLGSPTPLDPGQPPLFGGAYFVNMLDKIWAEFDTPEKRTAKRLKLVLEDVADRANEVNLGAMDLFELPGYKLPESERKSWRRDFLRYAKRLNEYRAKLDELDPASTDTESIYVGLIQRRDGAGPVPDVIMHLHLFDQLKILQDHAQEMAEEWLSKLLDSLAALGEAIDETTDTIGEQVEESRESRKRLGWWIFGGLTGAGLLAVVAAVIVRGGRKEREP